MLINFSGQDDFIDGCLTSLKHSLSSQLSSKSSIITTSRSFLKLNTTSMILNTSEKSLKTVTMIEKIPKTDILSGCVAFVDTWQEGGKYNRSNIFAKILAKMGAQVSKFFFVRINVHCKLLIIIFHFYEMLTLFSDIELNNVKC